VKTVHRSGRYLRVADPDWDNPLDGAYSARRGARWNAQGSFPVCYLNRELATARANARLLLDRLADLPFGFDDVDPGELPVLIGTDVDDDVVDIVTDDGCDAVGLPRSYPLDDTRQVIPWTTCQPIGAAAWVDGRAGIACRSAAVGAPLDGEELAWFQRTGSLVVAERRSFDDWYGSLD
jgi:RES domain-containing protein